MRKALVDSWVGAEWPAQIMETKAWLYLFTFYTETGTFLDDNGELTLTDTLPETLTLYRGAVPEYKEGLSWTSERDLAKWFGTRLGMKGQLYTITVPNHVVLAKLDDRKENEYIVDVSMLFEDDIEECDDVTEAV
jgi:hypothetical protein